jgi:hypothetical protein
MNAVAQTTPFSNALISLAARVRAEHVAGTAAMKHSFGHFIHAGELLIEAKAALGHGRWLPWLRVADVPPRSASRYMFFARNRARLEDQNGHVADLTVRTALDLLAGTPGKCRRRGDPGDLGEPFLYPPFSVFDTRTEAWQSRKRAWLALGIQSELGREGETFNQSSLNELSLQRRGLVVVLECGGIKAVAA